MADASQFKVHENTYHGFLSLLRWGTGVAVVAAFVVILLISQ